MKKLAILSSLALLVAPSFKGNAFTDLARNQIKMIDEAGDSSSNYETEELSLIFGSKTSGNPTKNITKENYVFEGYGTKNVEATFLGIIKGGMSVEDNPEKWTSYENNYAARFNYGSNNGNFTVNFVEGVIIEDVVINAMKFNDKNIKGTVTIESDNGAKKITSAVSCATFTDCEYASGSDASFDNGKKDKTTSLTFTGNATSSKKESFYISKITFKILVEKISTNPTVTYDYGDYKDDSWKTTDIVTSGETFSPAVEAGTQYGTDWYQNPTLVAWTKDDGTEFDFTKDTISEDTTLHAKWEVKKTTAVSNIETSETKAQLYYEYTATSGDTETTYTISKINLRFGGLVKKEYYDALEEHIKSVGMIYTTSLPNGTDGTAYKTLKSAVEANAITEENATILTQDVSEKKPQLTNDETNYLYNVCLDVALTETAITKTVYAIATMTFDNDETIYFSERSASVSSLAAEYQDLDEYTDNEDIIHTLMMLKEGIIEG